MAEFSDFFENAIINLMRNTAFTQTNVHVALFVSPVTDANLEAGVITNEVSGGGYARQLAGLTAPANGVSSNGATISFPVATANWGNVTHLALMNASTGGNVLMFTPLTASQTINTGNRFEILAGDLTVTIT